MNSRVIKRFLKQKATYWGNPVSDGQGGYTYDDPIEVMVRWTDMNEKFVNAEAEEVISSAVALVELDLAVKGMIALIQVGDLSSSELPADNGAYEIRQFGKVPDPTGKNFMRRVWL